MTSTQKYNKIIGQMNSVIGSIEINTKKPWLIEDRKKGSSRNGMRSSSKNP
jgi:hypothetical protein